MKHPHSRCERRNVRINYIEKRKRIVRSWSGSWADDTPPHAGSSYHSVVRYYDWLEWQTLSDEDKKIKEIQTILDKEEFFIPKWGHIWGRYAKFNLACGCSCCKNDGRFNRLEKRRRGRREQRDLAVRESISYEGTIRKNHNQD